MSKKFYPLWASIKFPVCNLPLNLDTYRYCDFNCVYCFSKNRDMITPEKREEIPNLKWLIRKMEKIHDDEYVNPRDFIEVMLKNKITMKGGVKSDCFQPREEFDKHTKQVVEILNDYNHTILFNTKSSNLYDVPITPKLHSFQLSVTNVLKNNILEPNISEIDERVKFYDELKDEGFKVNIRVQPFIPNFTTTEIFDKFKNPDHISIGMIHLQQRCKEGNDKILNAIGMERDDFRSFGAKMNPKIRLKHYKEFGEYLDEIGVSWNVSDPNMHIGTDKCCCGDCVVPNPLPFSSMTMIKEKGRDYSLDDVLEKAKDYKKCKISDMFTSNRLNDGCKTIEDFYTKRWDRATSPFSPKYNIDPDSLERDE